jgi:hypothetical protein
MVENRYAILKNINYEMFSYLFFDDHTNLFNCTIKLIKIDSAFVVNIEESEASCKETFFSLIMRAFLRDFMFEISLKTIQMILKK